MCGHQCANVRVVTNLQDFLFPVCIRGWYDQLGGADSPLADAIIDRIAHDSYRINITSIDAEHDRSMREVYGLDKELRE